MLALLIAFSPLHPVSAQSMPDPLHIPYAASATEPTDSLADTIRDQTLNTIGINRSDLRSFQHKLSGKDLNGKLKTVVIDYVGGELSLEQAYHVLKDLKPEMNEALEKNSRAKITVNIVKDGITAEEELRLKDMIDSLEILNPEYQVHGVSENTRLKMRELGKYFSPRYQTKNNKRWAFIRFIVNGTVVGIGIWNSYEYLPAAIGVGAMLGAASGFIQYYIHAFTQFLINAKTPAGEYARWYVTEIAVSLIFILGPAYFNIHPESWIQKVLLDLPLICLAAMGAQGALDVYRSNRFTNTIREIATGIKGTLGENARVFQRGALMGLDVFKSDIDTLRRHIRPLDYKERESTSRFFVGVSMTWAMLTVIGLAGESMFPALNLGAFELAFSSVVTYGGFTGMGLSAILLSRNYNKKQIRNEHPEWTPKQIANELSRRGKEFWAYMFLDKHIVKEVKALHPDWSIQQVREEVKRLESDPAARNQIEQELRIIEKSASPQSDLFYQQLTCARFFGA